MSSTESTTQPEPELALTEQQIHLIARALADPRRLELLRHIGSCPDSAQCTDIREATPVTAATLSHHMKELETAGLVKACRNGKFVSYTLRREILGAYTSHLSRL